MFPKQSRSLPWNHNDKQKYRPDLCRPVAGMSNRLRDKTGLYYLLYGHSDARRFAHGRIARVADNQSKRRQTRTSEVLKQRNRNFDLHLARPAKDAPGRMESLIH